MRAGVLTIDKRVENGHSAVRDTGIGMDLLQNYIAKQTN